MKTKISCALVFLLVTTISDVQSTDAGSYTGVVSKAVTSDTLSANDFEHVINQNFAGTPTKPYIKALGDFDSDGFLDLFVASALGSGMKWFRYPDWTPYSIRNSGTYSEEGQLGDVDRDGDTDIIVPQSNGIKWYSNPSIGGGDPTQGIQWIENSIGSDGSNIHDLKIGDLDNDGDLDVVGRYEKELNKPVYVWIQQSPSSWQQYTAATYFGEGLALGDFNGDGFLDIALNGKWVKNNGNGQSWTIYNFAGGLSDQSKISAADINNDNRDEIFISPQSSVASTSQRKLVWYTLPNTLQPEQWQENIIESGSSIDKMHGLEVGDMDDDGDLDVTTSKRHDANGEKEVSVYVNLNGAGTQWQKVVIANTGSHNHIIGDIGNDGDLDIVGANWFDAAKIDVWLNHTTNIIVSSVPPDNKPKNFDLLSNYPNPFNPSTTIEFWVPAASHVVLTIYNILGQKVRTLVDQTMDNDKGTVTWDGRDNQNRLMSSGVYIYKMQAGEYVATRKMILSK